MYDRNSALKKIDATRSVLERLPEAACGNLFIHCYSDKAQIQFFGDTFAAACDAFPFAKQIRHVLYDGSYDAEEFYVDGVRLFRLVEKKGKGHE